MKIRINLFQFVAIILSVATLCESAKASLRIIPIRFFLILPDSTMTDGNTNLKTIRL